MSARFVSMFLFAFAAAGTSFADRAKIKWAPELELGKDVFPSLLISTATVDWNGSADAETENDPEALPLLGDPNSWFGVLLENVPAGATIEVEASGDGWLKPSKFTGKSDKAADELRVRPKMIYDYEALHRVLQQRPVNLTFKVKVNGASLNEVTETLVMHSIHDCPYLVDNGEDQEPTDLSWMFAAYVNENHPIIDGLLKEALKTGLVDSFTGYQEKDTDVVLTQVFAIWHVLQRKGIKYSDVSTTPGAQTVAHQAVRFLDESVASTQANCVDGSVLFASILRKIGLDVHLVLVPGHCYLAFYGDKDGKSLLGLETTMLGTDKLKPVDDLPKMPDKIKKKEFAASLKTFESALGVATKDLLKNAEKFEEQDESDYQLISIEDARDFGIKPIASGERK